MPTHAARIPLSASGKPDRRKENASHTQAALERAALDCFYQSGYEKTALSSICAQAGVTVGAIYHHYGDKKSLFAVVVEQLDARLVHQALQASTALQAQGGSPWQGLEAALSTVLHAATDAAMRRLLLVDAPAVLGAQTWGDIRQRQGLGAMRSQIALLQAQGEFAGMDAERVARMVLGALYGGLESLPDQATDVPAALLDIERCLLAMLRGLRQP